MIPHDEEGAGARMGVPVGAVDIDRRRLERGRGGYHPHPPAQYHHHQQPNSLQTAAGMEGPMPLTMLLLMVGLSRGGSTDEAYQGGEWVKRRLQEFTETATTVKSTSTDSKLLTVQSSQDPRYGQDPRITHGPNGVGGSVSESLSTRTTTTPTTTPMSASEMRTRHEMAVCQACLNGEDSKQEICKSCVWKNGVYVMESPYQTKEATTTSETPAEFVPTIQVVDPMDKRLPMDKSVQQQLIDKSVEEQPISKSVEQPIDKINISAFVSDFNSDSPDSSSEVKTIIFESFCE